MPASSILAEVDQGLTARFLDSTRDPIARYKLLFEYFLTGFLEFRTPTGERVFYPGHKGLRGHRIEGLEGFARTVPLLASWIASGRDLVVDDPRSPGHSIDLVSLIRDGLLAGSDPDAESYWGDIGDMDQRAVEASDVALILWLTRDHIWARLADGERRQIARWLKFMERAQVSPNNWLLFKVLALETLHALGMEVDRSASRAAWGQHKLLYRGSGWFYDPPMGIDFYNAWAISYSLYWIDQVNPRLDRAFIRDALRQSAELTSHLIAPDGIAIMGRSLCYRMAVPCPVLIQSSLDPATIPPGQARHALDAVWSHFIARGGLAQGAASQGYHAPDKRFLERYSGPASCQWSLRSLVIAFQARDGDPLWTDPVEPLPVEAADYVLPLPELDWVVEGCRQTGEISITIPGNEDRRYAVEQHRLWRRVVELIFRKPHQPQNTKLKYRLRRYSSSRPLILEGRD